MKNRYDVIVVGAGPGGCFAAEHAACAGLDVLLIDRKREIGVPVRCAEAVFEEEIIKFVGFSPKFVAAKLKKIRVIPPNGTELDIDVNVYILERRSFEKELACRAGKAGAEILLRTRATGLVFKGQSVSGVVMERMGERCEVESKIVIAADGVESQVGRWAGLSTIISPRNIGSTAQYLLGNVIVDPSMCIAYLGKQVAPGGYAWIFPKGAGKANVGLGVSGKRHQRKTPVEYLDEFVQAHYPDSVPLACITGSGPLSGTLKKIVSHGLMLVGDAARQVNPATGAGITEAMHAGREAAKVAAEAFEQNDFSESFLQRYKQNWNRLLGNVHQKNYYWKEVAYSLPETLLESVLRLYFGFAGYKA